MKTSWHLWKRETEIISFLFIEIPVVCNQVKIIKSIVWLIGEIG